MIFEMRLKNLFAYGSLAVFAFCACTSAHPGSSDLADSVKAVIDANKPENWPDRCKSFRAEILYEETASAPQTVEPVAPNSEMPKFQSTMWNGIRIPIPDAQFDKVALIPGSLVAVKSESTSVLFSILDWTPHFEEHFGGIEAFSDYVESGNNLVEWIEDGLALSASDIQCRPESMIDDLIRIIHSLFVGLAVTADEQSMLMRLNGTNAALVFGELTPQEKTSRIQYIFQHPSSKKIEMLTITYHLEQPLDVVHLMSAFVSAIDNGGDHSDSRFEDFVRAILDQDHERASSIAESIGLDLQLGLQ